MLVRLFGIMDTMSASLLLLHNLFPLYWKILLLFGAYHLTKAIVFKGDVHSLLDGLAGLTLLTSMLIIIPGLNLLLSIYLFQKGLVSLHA